MLEPLELKNPWALTSRAKAAVEEEPAVEGEPVVVEEPVEEEELTWEVLGDLWAELGEPKKADWAPA